MHKLLTDVTETGDSPIQHIGRGFRGEYRPVRVLIEGGTATVALYGRADPTDTWEKITEFTATGAIGVLLLPQVKFTVSAISGATVNAWVDGDKV